MEKSNHKLDELRLKAEKLLRAGSFKKPKTDFKDTQTLIEELLIYHAELEVQNAELREAQGALEISRNRYFELFDLAPVGYLALDNHGIIVEANFTASEMLGIGRSYLRNTAFSALVAAGYQEIFFRHIDKVLHSRGRADCEIQVRESAGKSFHVRMTSSFIESAPESHASILATLVDLTERRKAEEALREGEKKYRAVVEGSREGICVVQGGAIQLANPALADMFGRTETQVRGAMLSDFINYESSDPKWPDGGICDVETTAGSPFKVDLITPKGRRPRRVEILANTVEWEGRPAALVFVSDITDKENLQNLLLRSQKLEALGVLAGGIAHDFNNLLHIISGHCQLLMMDKTPLDDGYKNLEAIQSAVDRGAGLVKQILAFGRRIDSVRRPINLNDVVLQSVTLIRNAIPRMIHIETLTDSDLKKVNGDPSLLEQTIVNLALNAKDAMPDGGKLTISTRNIEISENEAKVKPDFAPGSYVELTVTDNGEGIPGSQIELIFDPFFSTKQLGKGSGLGLSAVFGIVRSHNGHIVCESVLGEGTTFRISLPSVETDDYQGLDSSPESTGTGGKTILLVDDEAMVREFVETLLDRSGYNVISATNGVDALIYYRTHRDKISLVILDLLMPEMGGRQCLHEILAIDPHARVIVASGYSTELDEQEAIAAGAVAFLGKPFKVSDLLDKISNILGQNPV